MVARQRGGALLVRAGFTLVAIMVVTGAWTLRSPVAAGLAPTEAVDRELVGPIAADRQERGPVAESPRAATAGPDRIGRTLPTAAHVLPLPPRAALPKGSTTARVSARSSLAAVSSTGNSHRAAASTAYRGRNHVWIPSLGITRSVQSFPCSRVRPPDGGVYRWGCAGRNNVYLMSHAWSTFRPLHDAYTRGRLRKGMTVWYADGGGRVHPYSVIWWRITAPTTAASWAWAALSRPGMTLQTCVGARSQYRLMVRLVRVG